MATSGTYNFTMVGTDFLGAALRLTGRFDPYDTIPTTDLVNVAQAFEILLKELAIEGLPLWKVQTFPVPLLQGVAAYNLSTITNSTLPMRVLQSYIRDSAGNDVEITLESRYDYNLLGQKATQGVPNQGFYDPQLGAGSLTLYDVPQDATRTLYVVVQMQTQDLGATTNTVDFPQEGYRMLKWCLADEIALEYDTPPAKRAEIAGRALTLRKDFSAEEQEQVSVFFTPSQRSR
jgi:hypothetical protein